MNPIAIIQSIGAGLNVLVSLFKDRRDKLSGKRVVGTAIVAFTLKDMEVNGMNVLNVIVLAIGAMCIIFSSFEKE